MTETKTADHDLYESQGIGSQTSASASTPR